MHIGNALSTAICISATHFIYCNWLTRLARCVTCALAEPGNRTKRRRGFARLYRTLSLIYLAVALYKVRCRYSYISQLHFIKCVADIHIAVALYKVRCRYIYISQLHFIKCVADIHIAVALYKVRCRYSYISQLHFIKCVADIHIAVAIYKVRCRYTYRSCTL